MSIERLPHEWSKEALLTKAHLYANEMLSHDQDNWLFSFWSALTLEILIRAAISNISPALLADSKHWSHLYYSLGHTPTEKKYNPKSVSASELISRMESIYPNINRDIVNFCATHLDRRNRELHSGAMAFDNLGTSKWLADFYLTCREILSILGESLESFFGKEEADSAKTLIDAAEDKNAKDVFKSIEAHKVTWSEKDETERNLLKEQTNLQLLKNLGHQVNCPACGCNSILHGTPYKSPTQALDNDSIIEKQVMLPSSFECKACSLKIIGFRKLNACGLGDTFLSTSYYDPSEYFGYDPDEYDIYAGLEDDNNEPY